MFGNMLTKRFSKIERYTLFYCINIGKITAVGCVMVLLSTDETCSRQLSRFTALITLLPT